MGSSSSRQNTDQCDFDQAAYEELNKYFHSWGQRESASVANDELIRMTEEAEMAAAVVAGGAVSKNIADYHDSMYRKAKEDLIRKIAMDVVPLYSKVKITSDMPIGNVLDILDKEDMLKKRQTFKKKDPKALREKCVALAKSINKHFGNVIDVDEKSTADLCKKTNEVMQTLARGMHAEFLSVVGDVKQTATNMAHLQKYLQELHKKYEDALKSDKPDKELIKNLNKFYELLDTELSRQRTMLTNTVNVVIPKASKDALELLKKGKSYSDVVARIDDKLDSRDFARKLTYLIAGVDNMGKLTDHFNKSLTEIGLSKGDLKGLRSLDELRDKVFTGLIEKNPKGLSKDQIKKFNKFMDLLVKDGDKMLLEKSGGAPNDVFNVKVSDEDSLETRLKQQEKFKDTVFSSFTREMKKLLQKLVVAISKVSKDIGSSVPVNDDLFRFKRAVDLLDIVNDENLHLALTGYNQSVSAREYRRQFLYNLDIIRETVQPLVRYSASFKNIQDSVRDIEKLLVLFEKNLLGPISDPSYVRGGHHCTRQCLDHERKVSDHKCDDNCSVHGGNPAMVAAASLSSKDKEQLFGLADSLIGKINPKSSTTVIKHKKKKKGGDVEYLETILDEDVDALTSDKPSMEDALDATHELQEDDIPCDGKYTCGQKQGGSSEDFISLNRVKLELKYRISIANMKQNLKRSAKDEARAQSDYKEMVGKSIANMLNKDKEDTVQTVNEIRKVLSGNSSNLETAVASQIAYELKEEVPNREAFKKVCEAHIYILSRNLKARQKFYETLEAIDLSLSSFTENVQAKPEDVIDLKNVLDQLVNIREFYNIASGNRLAELYEYMSGNDINIPENVHYYDVIKSDESIADLENLDIVDIKTTTNIYEKVKRAYMGVRALENLIATYTKLGEKLKVKSFISGKKIFTNLVEYLTCSSLFVTEDHKIRLIGESAAMPEEQAPPAGQPANRRYAAAYSVPPIGAKIPNTISNPDLRFFDTRDLFGLLIKAMCCKIYTVLGLYEIFNRPLLSQYQGTNLSLGPMRTILGGDEKCVVNPEISELYVRLPLLAEFYRDTISINRKTENGRFEFKERQSDTEEMIAFIPDVTGTWGEFIDLMFNKLRYIENGQYSDSDIKCIINAINRLYSKLKPKKGSPVFGICIDFVHEVNKRYGIIKKTEAEAYVESKWKSDRFDQFKPSASEGNNYLDLSQVEYDILGTEGDKSMPSDKYLLGSGGLELQKKEYYNRNVANTLLRFRRILDEKYNEIIEKSSKFSNNETGLGVVTSLSETFRYLRKKLATTKDQSLRFQIVSETIRDNKDLASVGDDVVVIFNETVVAPLFTLYNLYLTIETLSNYINSGSQEEIVQYILDICDGKLLRCTLNNKKINLDFSAMKGAVSASINNIKQSVQKFRLLLDKNYIEQFISFTYPGTNVENKASLAFLEEKLLNDFLKNKSMQEDASQQGYSVLNKKLQDVTYEGSTSALFRKLILWDGNISGSRINIIRAPYSIIPKVARIDVSKDKQFNAALVKYYTDRNAWNVLSQMGGKQFESFIPWSSPGNELSDTYSYGVFIKFNQLLSRYVSQFIDISGGKFYSELLSPAISSTLGRNVLQGYTLSDIGIGTGSGAPAALATSTIAYPSQDSILFSSLAFAIKVLLNEYNDDGVSLKYAVGSLDGLSGTLLENMRANLCGYEHAFSSLAKRCDHIKTLLEKSQLYENSLSLQKINPAGVVIYEGLSRPGLNEDLSGNSLKNYYITLLNYIKSASASIAKCAANVYASIKDKPYFMEGYKDQFKNAKQTTGEYPLAFLSYGQKALVQDPSNQPFNRTDSKYARATNALVYDGSLDRFAGFSEAITMFNSVNKDSSFTSDMVKSLIVSQQTLVGYLHCNANIRGILSPDDLIPDSLMAFRDMAANKQNLLANGNVSDAMANMNAAEKSTFVVSLAVPYVYLADDSSFNFTIDSDTNDRKLSTLSKYDMLVYSETKQLANKLNTRELSQFTNILDIDVPPIDVHMLEREIPLVNILNYSYSFDQLIVHIFHTETSLRGDDLYPVAKNPTVAIVGPSQPKDLLAYTVLNPYNRLSLKDYTDIFTPSGVRISGMTTPKYLNDQLWTKVLLQSYNEYETSDSRKFIKMVDKKDRFSRNSDIAEATFEALPQNINEVANDRFSTLLIRNLTWFGTLQRVTRWYMDQVQKGKPNPLITGDELTYPSFTEFIGSGYYIN